MKNAEAKNNSVSCCFSWVSWKQLQKQQTHQRERTVEESREIGENREVWWNFVPVAGEQWLVRGSELWEAAEALRRI